MADLLVSTFAKRSATAFDVLTNSNAVLKALKEQGGTETFDGGTQIERPLDAIANPNAGWYSGYDTLPIAASEVFDMATYIPKQAAVPVILSGREKLLNAGDSQVFNILKGKMQNAERCLKNTIVSGVYSDGTANSGKQLTGLAAALTITPAVGTYGGIDRSTATYWRNLKAKGAGTDYAGALTAATITLEYNKMINNLVRGTDRTNLIIAGKTHYGVLTAAMQSQQQFLTDAKMQGFGFVNIVYQGVPVVLENSPSMGAATSYFLNTDAIKLFTHKKMNFTPLGETRTPTNQDSEITMLGWMGQLVVDSLALQGIVQD